MKMRSLKHGVIAWMVRVVVLGVAWLALAVLPAHAAVTFRAAASAGAAAGTAISYVGSGGAESEGNGDANPALPGGILAGDLLLCLVESHDVVAHGTPAGWTMLYSLTGTAHRASLFYKIAAGGDANPTITHSGGDAIIARCSAFRGVDSAAPFDATYAAQYSASGLSIATGSLTTVTPGAMTLFAAHINNNPGSLAWPAGWTQTYYSSTSSGQDAAIGLGRLLQASPGVVGPLTATANNNSGESHGVLLALRPIVSSLTINKPTGTVDGDVMVASIAATPSTLTLTAPAGWTLIRQVLQGSATISVLNTYYKIAGVGEPASYTWIFSGAAHAGAVGGIASFSGVDTSDPVDVEAGTTTGNSLNHAAPSVTTTQAGGMLITIHEFGSASTWTPPAGMTEAVDIASGALGGVGMSMEMNYEARPTAGATGTRTATAAANADRGATQSVVLKPPLHHLEIRHPTGSGLTCASHTLTIVACADAACTTAYTAGVNGTLSATGTPAVNWDGTTGGAAGAGFVIATGSSSVTKNVQVADAGSVVFGVASSVPVPTNAVACDFGSPACTFTAALAGFIFSDTTTGGSYIIPSQVSGVTVAGLYLRAVQASTTNPAVCTPAIIGQTTAVNMGYTCDDPATCSAGSLATINTTAVAPAGTPVSLTFDGNGAAPISARYDDVGQIRLTASKTVTPFGGATSVTMNGNSSAYVVRPHHFDLTAIKCTTADAANCGAGALAMPTPGDNPAAANAAGPSFIAAGTPFSVTVTARNALNGATPNFGKEVAPESVVLTLALVAPAGGNNPALGGSFGAFSNGVATGINFTWGEAGIVTLTPGIADGSYLGAGNTTGTASGNVGRFYPHHFALSGASFTNRAVLSCTPTSTFTYAGEKFRAALNLTAQNAANATTANYSGAFAKFDGAVPANYGFGAIDLAAPTPNMNLDIAGASSSGSWAAGVGTLSAELGLTRAAAPDGPYESFNLGVDPVDPDGVKLASYDLDVNNDTTFDHGFIGASKIRFGRLKLSNAHGSEVLDLPIGMQTQYWNGTAFVGNTDDNCTTLAPANITLGNYQGGITATNMGAGHVSFTGPFAVGIGNLKLTKPLPAPTGKGSVDVTVDLVAEGKTYLQGAWTGTSYNENPSARATFGVFKNPNEFIYLRENF